jgi:hypothetical protein
MGRPGRLSLLIQYSFLSVTSLRGIVDNYSVVHLVKLRATTQLGATLEIVGFQEQRVQPSQTKCSEEVDHSELSAAKRSTIPN